MATWSEKLEQAATAMESDLVTTMGKSLGIPDNQHIGTLGKITAKVIRAGVAIRQVGAPENVAHNILKMVYAVRDDED